MQHQDPMDSERELLRVCVFPGGNFFSCAEKERELPDPEHMIYDVHLEQFAQFLSFSAQRAWYRTHDESMYEPTDTG